ncbi:MAG: glycine cleavage system aminomethyltransferase GcvT [Nitriliruptorales bacterium]|nr:glycine cleavage system aminomethyltransferase GcvT [Nitriliruptorales bacterium]
MSIRSPLDDRHRQLGASMTDFAGWEMPLHYGSVVAEHAAVRDSCGIFDLSHLGTLTVTGPGAEATVQRAFTNDVTALPVGRAHYTLCLNDDGGIVDDLLVYHLDWGYFVVPNAANAPAVRSVVESVAVDCEVRDVKADMACIAVQGPAAADIVTAAAIPVHELGYLDCRVLVVPAGGSSATGGGPDGPPPEGGVLARSGYTGERGYELFMPAEAAPTRWDDLLEAGAVPVGLGARDTLRLEMGYPLHGQDISPATSPVEAGLNWAVKPATEFVGRDAYVAAKEAGARRRLWGLRVTDRGIPRAHCTVLRDATPIGETTSGTFSPTLKAGIAMAYLDTSVQGGDTVQIDVRGKALSAEVTRPPFVASSPK